VKTIPVEEKAGEGRVHGCCFPDPNVETDLDQEFSQNFTNEDSEPISRQSTGNRVLPEWMSDTYMAPLPKSKPKKIPESEESLPKTKKKKTVPGKESEQQPVLKKIKQEPTGNSTKKNKTPINKNKVEVPFDSLLDDLSEEEPLGRREREMNSIAPPQREKSPAEEEIEVEMAPKKKETASLQELLAKHLGKDAAASFMDKKKQ